MNSSTTQLEDFSSNLAIFPFRSTTMLKAQLFSFRIKAYLLLFPLDVLSTQSSPSVLLSVCQSRPAWLPEDQTSVYLHF